MRSILGRWIVVGLVALISGTVARDANAVRKNAQGELVLDFHFQYIPLANDLTKLREQVERARLQICDATDQAVKIGGVRITMGQGAEPSGERMALLDQRGLACRLPWRAGVPVPRRRVVCEWLLVLEWNDRPRARSFSLRSRRQLSEGRSPKQFPVRIRRQHRPRHLHGHHEFHHVGLGLGLPAPGWPRTR